MLNHSRYELIKKKYGHYASWAIWADEGKKPKDNMGDLRVFDEAHNPNLLKQLNPEIILVGLNISRGVVPGSFGNFHDPRPESQDYKIRYAMKGTPVWGAYMTDIIKDFSQKVSGKVLSYLSRNIAFEEENIDIFREEIRDLEVDNPTIIAFGQAAYTILERNLCDEFTIQRISHYSMYISRENYRDRVRSILDFN